MLWEQVEDLATYNSTASSTELVYNTACQQEQNWQSAYGSVANEFVACNDSRFRYLGTFELQFLYVNLHAYTLRAVFSSLVFQRSFAVK